MEGLWLPSARAAVWTLLGPRRRRRRHAADTADAVDAADAGEAADAYGVVSVVSVVSVVGVVSVVSVVGVVSVVRLKLGTCTRQHCDFAYLHKRRIRQTVIAWRP